MKQISDIKRKGQLNLLTTGIITLAMAAIVLVIGLIILQSIRDTTAVSQCSTRNSSDPPTNCPAFSSANKTLIAQGQFGDFWTIIVLAVVAAVVIGIILTTFGGGTRR